MKKTLLFMLLLLVGFSSGSFAQTNTTKRIHLSNGNVINFPVQLIDKAQVETHEGLKQLKITSVWRSGGTVSVTSQRHQLWTLLNF